MDGDTTDILGLPVPSNDPAFLTFVVVHILVALTAVVSGLVAMLSEKQKSGHPRAGKIYYASIAISFLLIIVLSIMRWPHNTHLLVIGILTFACAYSGRQFAKRKTKHWSRPHTICMGMSYVLLLTGFYVDNGRNLPLWNLFPQWFFYFFPSVIGVPIIIRVLRTHPLNKTT
jgi:uncharacterized membrane protein